MAIKTSTFSVIEARNRPSLFATPLAWEIATFTRLLIEGEDVLEPDRTAMIVASDECSLTTLRELAHSATQGTISPLRFAGASPGIVTGLSALEHEIRGPTLALTMRPEHAAVTILALIQYWLAYSDILAVLVIAHHKGDPSPQTLKGLIARSVSDELAAQVTHLCGGPWG